jgi:single-strand selective monofunctional uracil DNA glycosylase
MAINDDLVDALADFEPPDDVTHVYNPLEYARDVHRAYVESYGTETPREVLLVGMNPGPWGMAQTGVPFGDVDFVSDWMGLDGEVGSPHEEHPERVVDGFDCSRNEVSGSRLWGWAGDRFGEAEDFFEHCFVYNYCPLLFLQESGRNQAPSRFKAAKRDELTPPCHEALRRVADHFEPDFVIGVGNWARDRIQEALAEWAEERDVRTGRILHPSPANPHANQGWVEKAEAQFAELGVELP